jgi:hypothetical protein
MSTSGVYTYSTNRDAVILAAGRKINIIGDFETPPDTDPRMVSLITALNPLIKQMMTYGMPVWAITEQLIPFSQLATIAGVSIGLTGQTINSVAPLKVIQALRVDNLQPTTPNTVPMFVYTYEDYELLNNKGAQGAPVHCFYQPLRNSGVIKVWPLPDPTYWQVNGSLYIRYQRPVQDFTAATDEPDFPIEWNQTLIYGLAWNVGHEYGVDKEKMDDMKGMYLFCKEEVLSFGTEEGSLFLQPRQEPGRR